MKFLSRKTLIICASVLMLLWLFFPRYSSRWDIIEDEKMLEGKREYLKNRVHPLRRSAPNILIILADDLSRNDLTIYDKKNGIDTPHIASLAQDGVVFEQALASSPICAPSRAGMLTGRVQNRSGFDSQPMQIYPFFPAYYYAAELFLDTDEMSQVPFGTYPFPSQMKKQGVPHSELFLSEILKEAGFGTALVGKWHLGYGAEQYPTMRGFDHYYGFLEAFSYPDDPDKDDVVSFQHDLFWEKHIWHMKRKGASAIQLNGSVIKEDRHLTDAFTDESIDYIDEHFTENPDTPFFLYSSYNAPHTPFIELKEYYDRFPEIEDENRRIYAAMISHLDEGIGRLIEDLKERGIYDETLIVFASDNGGASYTEATDNGELAGGKMSQFEGGLEIPMIIKWPEEEGFVGLYEPMVSLMDVYSTALAALDLPVPGDRVIDSVNLLPYVRGDHPGDPHQSLFWKSDYNLTLRRGPWKLMLNTYTGSTQLYNLDADRGEYKDLSEEEPELLQELMNELEAKANECLPPMWPRVMDFEIEVHGKKYKFAT
ncbi:sulfatase-like hydrolase/transferase [Spirochaeta isovalerica]|uniref:Arylsulfatase A-like enzyme n=1 Tax=Spirochaeta isovalerica TaxID=150 RepID=A0A841R906_9SPIO|nr:sulfatase-like hydrolase/transferase [Spirochaeta isovalerica]MBB6479841.1 arylsulfatase A-like enzyme [Spirochaeta isovalerica]